MRVPPAAPVRRPPQHIELYARELEEWSGPGHHRPVPVDHRRLLPVYAAEEGLIEHSPAVHVRRPRLDYESHAVGLDGNELGAFLVAAGLASAQDNALASLLALNGLRISEALGAMEDLGLERDTAPWVHRKGGKVVTIPLAPRTARAVDLAIAERLEGPIFLDPHGARLRRDAAARTVRRLAKRAGIIKRIGPHSLRWRIISFINDYNGRAKPFGCTYDGRPLMAAYDLCARPPGEWRTRALRPWQSTLLVGTIQEVASQDPLERIDPLLLADDHVMLVRWLEFSGGSLGHLCSLASAP